MWKNVYSFLTIWLCRMYFRNIASSQVVLKWKTFLFSISIRRIMWWYYFMKRCKNKLPPCSSPHLYWVIYRNFKRNNYLIVQNCFLISKLHKWKHEKITLISSVLAVSLVSDPSPKSTVRHSVPQVSKIICWFLC